MMKECLSDQDQSRYHEDRRKIYRKQTRLGDEDAMVLSDIPGGNKVIEEMTKCLSKDDANHWSEKDVADYILAEPITSFSDRKCKQYGRRLVDSHRPHQVHETSTSCQT